jgi:hypothetical protein
MDGVKDLIHAAFIQAPKGHSVSLFLRRLNPHTFTWFEQGIDGKESETVISAQTIEEALRLAALAWRSNYFRTLMCGFRYTLPERDEHGINALFYQMVASYSTSNGVYFDEEIGCNCYIQNASDEARKLWKSLQVHENAKRN